MQIASIFDTVICLGHDNGGVLLFYGVFFVCFFFVLFLARLYEVQGELL